MILEVILQGGLWKGYVGLVQVFFFVFVGVFGSSLHAVFVFSVG